MPVLNLDLRLGIEQAHPVLDAVSEDRAGWPTTQRFSRRAGESVHDLRYASAIEKPYASSEPLGAGRIALIVAASALCGAALRLLCQFI